jgi:hypothetical protein
MLTVFKNQIRACVELLKNALLIHYDDLLTIGSILTTTMFARVCRYERKAGGSNVSNADVLVEVFFLW